MSTQNSLRQNSNASTSPQGSGSEYHREHAGHVPDYGGNSMDPNAKKLTNSTENNESNK